MVRVNIQPAGTKLLSIKAAIRTPRIYNSWGHASISIQPRSNTQNVWNGRKAPVTKRQSRKQRSWGCTESASVLRFIGNRVENLQQIKTTGHKTRNKTPPSRVQSNAPLLPFDADAFLFLLHVRTRGRTAILPLLVQASEHLPNNTTVPSSGQQQPETVSARFQNKGMALLTYIWYRNPNNRRYMQKGAS